MESKWNTTLRIVPVVLPHVFHMGSLGLLPPTNPFLFHFSDRFCCLTKCISLTISPVGAPRVFCHPPLPFSFTLRKVPVVQLNVFHLPSPQYGLPGSFATHPSLSLSLFGSFLLFYYMHFTHHLPSMGSLGLLPPTPPFLFHSSESSCCSTKYISLTISPVWAPWVFCHPPLPFCFTIRKVPVVQLNVFHSPSPQ